MTFTATHFSSSAGLPRGPSQHEVPPAYQALLLPSQRYPAGASFEKTEEGLAEELDIRLHLDSLPLPRSVRLSEYVIPSDGIRWDIIDSSISKLLGEEAYLWNTNSRSENGFYTIYATRPLTISQINDLRAWSAHADEDDQLAADIARKIGKFGEEYQARERETLRIQREQRNARDQDRWRREKDRRRTEQEFAWAERMREEKRRYFRQKAIAEEEFRLAECMRDRIRRMQMEDERDPAIVAAEDDENIPDESEWRRALIRKHVAAMGKKNHNGSISKKKRNWSSKARPSRISLADLQLEVVTRYTPRGFSSDD